MILYTNCLTALFKADINKFKNILGSWRGSRSHPFLGVENCVWIKITQACSEKPPLSEFVAIENRSIKNYKNLENGTSHLY